MNKKTNTRTIIRQIVREEVAMAIQEVISELKQPTRQVSKASKHSTKITGKAMKPVINDNNKETKFSSNPIIQEILSETEGGLPRDGQEEYPTMGGGTFDSSRMREVVSSQYGDMMGGKHSGETMVASMGVNPESVPADVTKALGRDYSDLVKAMKKKKG